jgi:ribonuclease P protein component
MEPDALTKDAGPIRAGAPGWARLRRRAEFQRVSRGRRAQVDTITLQAQPRTAAETAQAAGPRVGFTVTRKVGDAVERNRIRRRLKEALRASQAIAPAADCDYVLVARPEALTRRFTALVADIERAFAKVGRDRPAGAANQRRSGATDRDPRP